MNTVTLRIDNMSAAQIRKYGLVQAYRPSVQAKVGDRATVYSGDRVIFAGTITQANFGDFTIKMDEGQ